MMGILLMAMDVLCIVWFRIILFVSLLLEGPAVLASISARYRSTHCI